MGATWNILPGLNFADFRIVHVEWHQFDPAGCPFRAKTLQYHPALLVPWGGHPREETAGMATINGIL